MPPVHSRKSTGPAALVVRIVTPDINDDVNAVAHWETRGKQSGKSALIEQWETRLPQSA